MSGSISPHNFSFFFVKNPSLNKSRLKLIKMFLFFVNSSIFKAPKNTIVIIWFLSIILRKKLTWVYLSAIKWFVISAYRPWMFVVFSLLFGQESRRAQKYFLFSFLGINSLYSGGNFIFISRRIYFIFPRESIRRFIHNGATE